MKPGCVYYMIATVEGESTGDRGSCMMAGISIEARMELIFVPGGGRGGGITAERYINNIMQDDVLPYDYWRRFPANT